MMNRVTLVGALLEKPELVKISPTSYYFRFEIETEREWTKAASGTVERKTDTVEVLAWNKDWVEKFDQGDVLYVEGRLQRRRYIDAHSGNTYWLYEVQAQMIKSVNQYTSQNLARLERLARA
jgi:single-stranded DNA-binding protein